jgi:hypothetical protein
MKRYLLALSALILAGCIEHSVQRDPVYQETVRRHARPKLDIEVFDSQEFNAQLAIVFAEADAKAERLVGNVRRDSHFIDKFWSAKKKILLSEYGISWHTPAELNPTLEYEAYGQPALTDSEKASIRAILIGAEGASPNASILLSRWTDGTVNVAVREQGSKEGRFYAFHGHDSTWTYKVAAPIEE